MNVATERPTQAMHRAANQCHEAFAFVITVPEVAAEYVGRAECSWKKYFG